jgi:hypothetical protein
MKLRALQDDFYAWIRQYEPKLGVKFHRGTLAEHQQKAYTKKTDHLIGQLRRDVQRLSNEEIQQKLNEIKQTTEKAREAAAEKERRRKLNKGEAWKKGYKPFEKKKNRGKGRDSGMGV